MDARPHQISRLLQAYNFNLEDVGAPELGELSEVIGADYRTAPGLPSPELARELIRVAKNGADPRRKVWRQWRTVADYRVRMRGFDANEIAVHASPYTRGAGLQLWGFSCDARGGDDGAFVIFLNTAHQPGAVAATVAHELGHYIHRAILGAECVSMAAPLAANFASHLDDDVELFSDSLAALSAFGIEAPGFLCRRSAESSMDEITDALDAIDPGYRIDFAHPAVSTTWRIRYLAANLHFYKLRKALMETAGI
jgi:hypothetical protein